MSNQGAGRAMRGGRDGFSLVEALVSIAILAGVASTALLIVSSNVDRNGRATAKLRATLAAEMLLVRVGLDIPLEPQSMSGTLKDGSAWALSIRAYEEPGLPAGSDRSLFTIEVRVTPKQRPSDVVKLASLRLLDPQL